MLRPGCVPPCCYRARDPFLIPSLIVHNQLHLAALFLLLQISNRLDGLGMPSIFDDADALAFAF